MHALKCFVGAIALLAVACGGSSMPSTPVLQAGEGLLELPLVSTTAGRGYRLVGATFAITGPQSVTVTDTTADTVSVPLMAGVYSIQLNGPWHVERTDAPGQTVPVTLVSPNPMTFTLGEGQARPVRFLFKVPGDATADVGFNVDSGGWIAGAIAFEPLPPGVSSPFTEIAGTTVPFVISFESSTVTRKSWGPELDVETSPITVQFGGAASGFLADRLAPALEGAPLLMHLSRNSGQQTSIAITPLGRPGAEFRLNLWPLAMEGGVDPQGYPALQLYSFQGMADVLTVNGPSGMLRGTVSGQLSAH